ncbi:GFA family protein [Luteibacter sp. CQ10]|uniref:GFA family protein n=1 Tax=Luteibacter sp. CQ10 TaxID=2805821 RepID=UPI0034A0F224
MTDTTKRVHAGQCHCGAVRFEATLTDGFHTIRRCTCSYCRMRGAVVVSAEMGGIHFLRGEDVLTRYRFNTGVAEHFFCSRCGIYTHHQRRSNTAQYGVNVACLDGVSPFDFHEVPVIDGVRHPKDHDGQYRWAGTLRFEPAAVSDDVPTPSPARS